MIGQVREQKKQPIPTFRVSARNDLKRLFIFIIYIFILFIMNDLLSVRPSVRIGCHLVEF